MEETINIRQYFLMFKKRKWIILITLLLSIGVGVLSSYKKQLSYIPVYQANARIRINSNKNMKGQGFSPAVTSLNQNISSTYLSLAKSKSSLKIVIDTLGLKMTPEELSGKVSLTPDENNAEFITVVATDRDPKLAQKIANTVPKAFNEELIKTIGMDCVVVIDKAQIPKVAQAAPQSNAIRNFTILGAVLSIFIVLLLEFLNNKIVTPEDVEEYWGTPVIGVIPYDKQTHKMKLNKKIDKQSNLLGGE